MSNLNRRGFLGSLIALATVRFVKVATKAPAVPQVYGAGQTGNRLLTHGWTGQTLRQGDVFTILGVNARNPVTGDPAPIAQRFVVTCDVYEARGVTEIAIWPPLRDAGAYPLVASLPANGALIEAGLHGWGNPYVYAVTHA